MRRDKIVMLNEKAAFIAQLESVLLSDAERSGLDSICYEYDLTTNDEVIIVIFKGGGIKKDAGHCKQQRRKREGDCKCHLRIRRRKCVYPADAPTAKGGCARKEKTESSV